MTIQFDLEVLHWLLIESTFNLLQNDFGYSKVYHHPKCTFIDNGAPVLAVDHLDTVKDMGQVGNWKMMGKKYLPPSYRELKFATEIKSVGLDDRLGLYYILYVLPQLGINVDILMTTDEEIGQSSAQYFETEKKYNWMFQFDRHGYGNAVMYQYFTKKLDYILCDMGYDVQHGTFSDISMLEHLGCSGINFGCGYVNEHTNDCITRTDWMELCINMFTDFFDAYQDTQFVYEQPKQKGHSKISTAYGESFCFDCGAVLLDHEAPYRQCDICYDFKEEGDDPNAIKQPKNRCECEICGIVFAKEDLTAYGLCVDCRRE